MTALRIQRGDSGEGDEVESDIEPGDAPWTKTEMLLAELIDAVRENTYVLEMANSDKPKDVQQPDPVPRPGVKKTTKPQKQAPDPLLMEWLRRQQDGEDTSDLGLVFENVVPMRPYKGPSKTE